MVKNEEVENDEDEEDDIYHSKKFPTVNEIKGLINLIKAMKETYKFIHPLDTRDSNLVTKK